VKQSHIIEFSHEAKNKRIDRCGSNTMLYKESPNVITKLASGQQRATTAATRLSWMLVWCGPSVALPLTDDVNRASQGDMASELWTQHRSVKKCLKWHQI
jgi:hypothetical protein